MGHPCEFQVTTLHMLFTPQRCPRRTGDHVVPLVLVRPADAGAEEGEDVLLDLRPAAPAVRDVRTPHFNQAERLKVTRGKVSSYINRSEAKPAFNTKSLMPV